MLFHVPYLYASHQAIWFRIENTFEEIRKSESKALTRPDASFAARLQKRHTQGSTLLAGSEHTGAIAASSVYQCLNCSNEVSKRYLLSQENLQRPGNKKLPPFADAVQI
ncbi:hypothetical protein [Paraburkholderia sp. ZP32-5]|uniref:hypothetical protein n=1 Tax=Paraburkholderia sp. ZP32-5 TaxID=2883245 RepID=UPI001F2C7851|nr:hypothetical protein [Paraburkholderia sp. ZP32-5]